MKYWKTTTGKRIDVSGSKRLTSDKDEVYVCVCKRNENNENSMRIRVY